MRRALPQLPLYVFMAWCLVKHRDNLSWITNFELVRFEIGSEIVNPFIYFVEFLGWVIGPCRHLSYSKTERR
jgi:hypothetical protein